MSGSPNTPRIGGTSDGDFLPPTRGVSGEQAALRLEWIDDLPVIVTERMLMRVSELDEVGHIVRYLLRNKAHLQPWEPKRDDLYFTEKAWEAGPERDRHEARTNQAYRFRLLDKVRPRGEYIGTISLRDLRAWPCYHGTLGYSLDAAYEGQGLMREGVEAVIRFGFEQVNLRRIEACFMPANERSHRLLTGLGFQVEGLLRSSMEVDGKWEDHHICSLINPNWRRP